MCCLSCYTPFRNTRNHTSFHVQVHSICEERNDTEVEGSERSRREGRRDVESIAGEVTVMVDMLCGLPRPSGMLL